MNISEDKKTKMTERERIPFLAKWYALCEVPPKLAFWLASLSLHTKG